MQGFVLQAKWYGIHPRGRCHLILLKQRNHYLAISMHWSPLIKQKKDLISSECLNLKANQVSFLTHSLKILAITKSGWRELIRGFKAERKKKKKNRSRFQILK